MKLAEDWARDMGQFCGEYGPTVGMVERVRAIQDDALKHPPKADATLPDPDAISDASQDGRNRVKES